MRKTLNLLLLLFLLSLACNLPGGALTPTTPTAAPSLTSASTPTRAATPTWTASPLPSATPLPSLTPTISPTPTLTETLAPSATPTFAFPSVTVNQQAHCRYGPNVAYLHAADLYAGDIGTVRGRFVNSKWLFIKFDKLKYFCWVAPSVVDVTGDVTTIKFTEVYLPGPSVLYAPPKNISVVRDNDRVHINWEVVPMTDDDDRGYFLDLFVCQNGVYFWNPVALANRDLTSYTIKDEAGCALKSGGKLYAVEKHGYTSPVTLDWPAP
jgi:hypothetical protein